MRLHFVLLSLFITFNQIYSQNFDKMNFKEKVKFLKSNNILVEMNFNNDLKLNVYYSFNEDTIYLVKEEESELMIFKDFLDFSNYLYIEYKFDLDFDNIYNEFRKFKTIYLRHNLCLNKPFLLKIEEYKDEYLRKFNILFGVNISPYEKIPKESITQINNEMQNVIDNEYNKIPKYEVPLLIFVGEYFINKYKSKWGLSNAKNDFGNSFLIPFIIINGKDLELSSKIFRYLNNPKLKYGEEKFTFEYLLDLDFIITQTLFRPKKQN